MDFLLDTHTVIWFSENNSILSERAREIISNPRNNCYMSVVSYWEMAIKIKIKKLNLGINLFDLEKELIQRGFVILPIKIEHVIKTIDLELHHSDPFDRLLISQAIIEKKQIISRDNIFDKYGQIRIW
ncbi:MAG: type II toxin-antitoxin system VapC family toxin [Candidatus Kapabacteria bacterium]|nr:type II toxin-antitoxin system VapC family toxin [Candidatus Kapabacteria bacterium]